ncbi:hypothetical protein Q6348_08855 [Isoptericola sp. b441]|uniref:Uncharacterized protein n=1 Tax=Actinotalea lenta TaxID=3064654 RepID=A0ABT9D9X5_9CELL|nr:MULTISPECIES: hypothetical protein [unclassified Isoptericola]MDO8107301.1 hypothetical protein [Isoptericola sp. b441]MDO8121037.1 hypothetical protein [Isoptericola sp. b490]
MVAAWTGVALVLPALLGGMLAGEALMSALGYGGLDASDIPGWALLVTATTVTLIVWLPAGIAVGYGLRARRLGDPNGLIPAVIGVVVGVGFLLTNLLGFVGQLVTGG